MVTSRKPVTHLGRFCQRKQFEAIHEYLLTQKAIESTRCGFRAVVNTTRPRAIGLLLQHRSLCYSCSDFDRRSDRKRQERIEQQSHELFIVLNCFRHPASPSNLSAGVEAGNCFATAWPCSAAEQVWPKCTHFTVTWRSFASATSCSSQHLSSSCCASQRLFPGLISWSGLQARQFLLTATCPHTQQAAERNISPQRHHGIRSQLTSCTCCRQLLRVVGGTQ